MKKCLSVLLALILAMSSMILVVHAESVDLSDSGEDTDLAETGVGSVESAISWAISIANDDSHGYSQRRRTGPDYDCSSFVSTAFKQAGFALDGTENTGTMKNAFVNAGFAWIPASSIADYPAKSTNLKRGDVLLGSGHTALYIGNDKIVHAINGTYDIYDDGHPGDQTGNEIAVKPFSSSSYSRVGGWLGVLRYGGAEAIDLGSKFYANIVPTSSDTKGVASTGVNYKELASTGAGSYTTIPSLKISRVVQSGDRDCHWCSMITTVGYALGSYSYGNYSTNYRIAGKDYSSYNDAVSQKLLSHSNSHVADSDMSIFPVSMKRESGGSIGNNEYTYKKLYNLLQQGKPISVYATGNSPHASVIIGYKENSSKNLSPSGFIVLEVKLGTNNWWHNSTNDYNNYANNPQIDDYYNSTSCYVTLASWLSYHGSNKTIKTICYPAEIKNAPVTQSYQDLGAKFYANIVPTGAGSLAVAANGANTNGTNVSLAALDYSDSQKWLFERKDGNAYKITNIQKNKCLDVDNYGTANGTNIQLWTSNDSTAQRWYIVKNGAGYRLVPQCSPSSCLDITGAKLTAGTNIEEWTQNDSAAQRFTIKKLVYNLNYTPNGASGSVVSSAVSERDKITIKACPFSRSGYTFGGYFLYRSSDDKWYTESNGWVKASDYKEKGYKLKLFSPNQSHTINATWTNGVTPNSSFALQAQWLPNESKVNFADNYSGCNYLLGSDLGTDYSNYIKSRDTSVYTLSLDPIESYNNQNTLKIIGASAGSTGKDLGLQTTTNDGYGDGYSYAGIAGDTKNMVMSFNAKSSVDGAKFYIRWGYSGVFQSVTLAKEWQHYEVQIPKVGYFGSWIHPYFDTAGTFWLNSIAVSDGTTAPDYVPETGRWAANQMVVSRGSKISKLPNPQSREGYTFIGWYTAANGGTAVTESTAIQAQKITLYAHWVKDNSVSPAKTAERNGHRYEFYDQNMTWPLAYRFCESKGGHLATISSKEENDLVYSLINKHAWLGGCDIGRNKDWYWVNGEPLTYTNWREGQPDAYNGLEHYMMMYYNNTMGGTWNDYDDSQSIGFVCEYDDLVDPDYYTPVLSQSYNGKTYEIYDDAVDWLTAKSICSKKGGNLVVINDSTENEFVFGLISRCYKKEYWIGATDIANEGEWLDIFGNYLIYSNWAEGEPNNTSLVEDRALMNHSDGTWNDFKGFGHTYHSMGFICEYDSKIQPKSIVIDLDSLELVEDESYQLSATVYPFGAETTISWSSDDESIVSIDEDGYITAVAVGETWIVATTDNGLTAQCRVTVNDSTIYAENIVLSDDWLYLEIGETKQLSASVYPEEADQDVVWSSEDESIVTIDETGLLTAISEGETYINVQSADQYVFLSCPVYVTPKCVEPEYVEENGFGGIVNDDGTVYLFFYDGDSRDIIIPSTIEGKVVSEISYYFLEYEKDYDSVTVPKSISTIGFRAFGYFVDYPDEETVIEDKLDHVIIKGYKGSAAESYASEYGFTFVALDDTTPTEPTAIILGDVDGDGQVTIIDATCIQRHLAELPTFAFNEKAADSDEDGQLTIIDATCIQRHLAELKTNDSIGKPIK